MDRKLIRPSLTARAAAQGASRRAVAPESTHAEAGYLVQTMESEALLIVQLLGGEEIRGRLEGYDRDVLILGREGSSPLVVRKERVRAYWMERKVAEASQP